LFSHITPAPDSTRLVYLIQAGDTLHQQMSCPDELSEQGTLDLQAAIAASLNPSMPSTSAKAFASTSAQTLDDQPIKRVKQEEKGKRGNQVGREIEFNPLKLKKDALAWLMMEKRGAYEVLSKALYSYALGKGPPSLEGKPPEVVRWGKLSALVLLRAATDMDE